MKPVYERFIENPDFTKSEFVELIKCAEDPEAVRRLKEEAVRIREIYYGKKVFTRGLIEYTNFCKMTAITAESVRVIQMQSATV